MLVPSALRRGEATTPPVVWQEEIQAMELPGGKVKYSGVEWAVTVLPGVRAVEEVSSEAEGPAAVVEAVVPALRR